jgi:type I restriction enzyme, S subunit
MREWRSTHIGDEIELAYGKALPAHVRKPGTFKVFGSNGVVGTHVEPLIGGPGIIVGRKGSVGEVTFSPEPFWPIDTTYFVVNKAGHNWRFLHHILRTLSLDTLNNHSAVPGLNREDVYSIKVTIPELSEQKLIAGVMDTIERSIVLEDGALFQAARLMRATMRELLTRGLRGEAQKETEIGVIPESWTPRSILDLCDILSGGTPRKAFAEYWAGSIPWASGKDLKVATLDDTIDHLSQAGVEAGSRVAPSGTVLILVRGMGLAKDLPVSVISRPMAFNQDLKALVSRGEFSGKYIRSAIYFGKDRLLSRIVPSAHGTMTLNLDDIESFKVACPSHASEAEEIVAVLDAIERKADLHKRKCSVLDDLFKALLRKLMSGEIRVADLDLLKLPGHAGASADGRKASHHAAEALG